MKSRTLGEDPNAAQPSCGQRPMKI